MWLLENKKNPKNNKKSVDKFRVLWYYNYRKRGTIQGGKKMSIIAIMEMYDLTREEVEEVLFAE